MQYWFPQVPVWIWCVVFCAVIFGLNIISTRFFAEGEFWFSLVKVITIVAFIILGGAAIFGIIPMQDGSPAPGLQYHRRRLVPTAAADPDDHGGGELRLLRDGAYRHCRRRDGKPA